MPITFGRRPRSWLNRLGGLAPTLAAALATDETMRPTMAVKQNDLVDKAAEAGKKQQRLAVALFAATLGSTIITAARRDSVRRVLLLKLSGGLLLLDVVFVGVVLAT